MIKDKRKRIFVAAVTIVVVGVGGFIVQRGHRKNKKKPNIIFILIDALRADRLGLYGYNRDVSPAIDGIASEGVIFERPISQAPWTQPSMASIFCGQYVGVHKVVDYSLVQNIRRKKLEKIAVFNKSFVTLAEVLRDNGYITAGFSANPLTIREYGFAQGFEHYEDRNSLKSSRGDILNAKFIEWLGERNTAKPFFVYLHYMDVHGPYYARDEFVRPLMEEVEKMPYKRRLTSLGKSRLGGYAKGRAAVIAKQYENLSDYLEFWSALYDAGIREMNYHIAELVRKLREMNLWDDAYVIITADHGEELYERGMWNHGVSLYDTELYVPLLLRWRGNLPADRRISGTVRLIDLMPTIMEQLDIPMMEDLQGRSLIGDINRYFPTKPVAAYSEGVKFKPNQSTVYVGDWKVIADTSRKNYQLYNIAEDPQEKVNLSAKYPEKTQSLVEVINEQRVINEQLGKGISVKEAALTPEQYKRLKSLGYVE